MAIIIKKTQTVKLAVIAAAKPTLKKLPVQLVAPEAQVSKTLDVMKAVLADLTDEQVADTYGFVKDKVDSLQAEPAFNRFKEVAKELNTRIEANLGPTDDWELTGENWTLQVGPQAKAAPDITDLELAKKLLEKAEKGLFMKLVKINIGDLKKYLTPEQVASITTPADEIGYIKKRTITPEFRG